MAETIVAFVAAGVTFVVFGAQIIDVVHKTYDSPTPGTWTNAISLKVSIDIIDNQLENIRSLRSSRKFTGSKQLDQLLIDCLQTGNKLLTLLRTINKRGTVASHTFSKIKGRARKTRIQRLQKKLRKYRKIAKAEFDLFMCVP